MRILFVDMQYDYGVPARGPNQIGLNGFLRALRENGHEVSTFFYDHLLEKKEELQREILAKADEVRPDLIVFVLFQDQFETQTLDLLKKNYVTLNWFGDDSWRFDSFTRIYAPHFTWCVTTDFFSLPRYRALGCEKVIFSQWAAFDEALDPLEERQPTEFDVSFIGAASAPRRWFVRELKRRGITVHAFGPGWENGSVSTERMKEIFRGSRISLNISNSVPLDYRFYLSGLRPWVFKARTLKTASQTKARNFEIPYYGGFQLTDYVPSLEKYFRIGEEVACYSSIDECEMLIRHYLADEAARRSLLCSGASRARDEHGYFHRWREIFKKVSDDREMNG